MSAPAFTGMKIFSTTLARDREQMGETITRWLAALKRTFGPRSPGTRNAGPRFCSCMRRASRRTTN